MQHVPSGGGEEEIKGVNVLRPRTAAAGAGDDVMRRPSHCQGRVSFRMDSPLFILILKLQLTPSNFCGIPRISQKYKNQTKISVTSKKLVH